MTQVKSGDTVAIHYTGYVALTAAPRQLGPGREPLEFTVRVGQIIPGLRYRDTRHGISAIPRPSKSTAPKHYGDVNPEMRQADRAKASLRTSRWKSARSCIYAKHPTVQAMPVMVLSGRIHLGHT